jgi:hypothetical protein
VSLTVLPRFFAVLPRFFAVLRFATRWYIIA